MKKIKNTWEIADFCRIYGRIMPHFEDNTYCFSEFHCSRLDDVKIVCSEENKHTEIRFIIGSEGYVVQFENEDNLLFCTYSELQQLKEESKIVEKEESKMKEEERKENTNK